MSNLYQNYFENQLTIFGNMPKLIKRDFQNIERCMVLFQKCNNKEDIKGKFDKSVMQFQYQVVANLSIINQCTECIQNCSLCSSSDSCIQCIPGYSLNNQGQCVSSCGVNQLKSQLDQQCDSFPDFNCQQYNYQNQCNKCKDGYVLNENGMCKNTYCSQFQGTYDKLTQKCSLDGYLLSDYIREQQNQQSSSQLISDSFNFQYSSLKESLNEQIVEINVLDILDHKLVIGRTNQHLIFYDYSKMSALYLLDMQAPILQILTNEQQMKLYALVSHLSTIVFMLSIISNNNKIIYNYKILLKDKNNVAILNGHDNTYVYINKNLGNIMYFQNSFLFMQFPQNQLFVVQSTYKVNQNLFFKSKSPYVLTNDIQQIIGEVNPSQISIYSLKDGSKKVYLTQYYFLDINYIFYNQQNIKINYGNQSALFGLNKQNIIVLNNDINYLSIYDSSTQQVQDNIVFGQNIDFNDVQSYQIIVFSQDNLIICIRNKDYYIVQLSPLKVLSQLTLSDIQNIYISNEYGLLIYTNFSQNNNNNIQLTIYGISDFNLFQATLNYQPQRFKYPTAQYLNQNLVQVTTQSFIDNYKHIILQQQISQKIQSLRYQIYFQPPSKINQFPVINTYKSSDIVEIYSADGLNSNQKYQLQISSTQFISDQFLNLKIGNMILNLNATDSLNFNKNKQLNFNQTMILVNNSNNIQMQNIIVTNNNFSQGLIYVNQSQNFVSSWIQFQQNQINDKNIQQYLINPYLFSFLEVKQVQFDNVLFSNSLNLGFVNFTGLMINFQFLYSMSIKNAKFDELKQNLPVILVTYGISTIITNLSARNMKSQFFILLSLVNYLELTNISFSHINEPFVQIPKLESTLIPSFDNYLLSLGGIHTLMIQSVQMSYCYNIGMINLNEFQVGLDAVQNSNIIQANQIEITDSQSIRKEPAINLKNKVLNIFQLSVKNITFKSHILNLNEQQNVYINQSQFINIQLKDYSTTINYNQIQVVEISNVKFQNISSQQYPSVFLIKSVDNFSIHNCTFRSNQNLQADKQITSTNDNHSNFNIQNCINLIIEDSLFVKNTCFSNGGGIYLQQIQNSQINNSKFILNEAKQNSGGAVYASNSNININQCIFQDNISKQERGGAIYSDNAYIQIINSNIINNIAYVGGGIYYNKINTINIDKATQIYGNKGRFYGNNIGSYPKKLLKVDLNTKQVYNKIIIKNFQSGNYTKQPIYVQYFDEENQMLNFNIADLTNQFSLSIKQEIESYQIAILNPSKVKNLTIILGQQLSYIKTINLFQLNITAGNYYHNDFQLVLFSQFQGQQLTLDLLLNFRKCKVGEIQYPKQGYISCDQCAEGSYSFLDPYQKSENGLVQCQKCPLVYARKCYSNQIILVENYWRESSQTDVVFLCSMLGCNETAYNSINGCIKGYIGPLCNSCDYKGIYWGTSYAQQGKYCYECSKIIDLYVFVALSILFYAFYIALSVYDQIKTNILIIKIEYLRKLEVLFVSRTKFLNSDTGIILKIFFHYLQIFSSSIDVFSQIPDIIGNLFKLGGDPTQITYTSLDYMESSIQRQLILIVCFIYIMMTMQLSPYKQKQLQNLEILLLSVVIISLSLQTIIYMFDGHFEKTLVLIIIILSFNLYNFVKIIFEYYKSALDLALRSKSKKLKKFLGYLYKFNIIKFDIQKRQTSLYRISQLWRIINKNKHLLNYEFEVSLKQQTISKSQKNYSNFPGTQLELLTINQTQQQDISDICPLVSYFFQSSSDQCQQCLKNCSECFSNEFCVRCMPGFILGQCVGNCGDNQLKNFINQQCQNFPDINCQRYNQQNQCYLCKDGYILNENKICKNTFCSAYQGTYDVSTQKCSLDGFLLSDYSREQQNQQTNAQQIQDSFNFQYSQLKDSLNEQIVEIIVLDILDYKLVLGRTVQYIIFYEYKTMQSLYLMDMKIPIIQIQANQQQMKLYALISHCDTNNSKTKYVLNSLISIDIASYQQNIIIQYNDIVDQGLFNEKYLIFRKGSIFVIFSLSDLSMKTLQTNVQISSYSFLQSEGIVLFTDNQNNLYLTNPLFTGFNLINLSQNQRFQMIKLILYQSLISIIQTDQSSQKQSLIIFGIKQYLDSQNQIYYTLGQQNQIIQYDGQNIQFTNVQDMVYLISTTEIQIWKDSKQVTKINIENSIQNFIQDDSVIVTFNQNIQVYVNIQSNSQIEKQIYEYPIRSQINTVFFYNNSILVSAYNTIYAINYYQQSEKAQFLQSFSQSTNQLKLDQKIKQTQVYSEDGIKVTKLIIFCETEYYIVGYVENQQITFKDNIGSQIISTYIILQNLFILADQQLHQLSLITFEKKQISFTQIIKTLSEADNFYVIDQSDPSNCQQLQITKFTSDQMQVCTLQFPNDPQYQDTCFNQILMQNNLVIFDAGQYFLVFQYDCSVIYQTIQYHNDIKIIDSNTLLIQDFTIKIFQIDSKTTTDIQLSSIKKFDIFQNILVLCVEFQTTLGGSDQLLKKINLNKYINFYPQNLNEFTYDQAVSNFIIKINGQNLQYMDMSYPFFSYSSVSLQDTITSVETVSNSNSLLLIRFQNDKYSAVLLDGHTNTQFQINNNIYNIMYFQNSIMFLQKPYNKLLVLKSSNDINQNIYFDYVDQHIFTNEFQQIIGKPNGNVIEILYQKDGSKKVFKNLAIGLNQYLTNYIEDTYLYGQIDIEPFGVIILTSLQTGKLIQIQQPQSYKILKIDDTVFILIQDFQNKQIIIDSNLNILQETMNRLQQFQIYFLWKENFENYFISISQNKFTIFNTRGFKIISLVVLQMDTLSQIQTISIQNDFVFVGNDQINKIQIFRQTNNIILFKLLNTSLQVIPLSIDITNKKIFIDSELGILIICDNNGFQAYILSYFGQTQFSSFKINTDLDLTYFRLKFNYNQHLSTLLVSQAQIVYQLDINYFYYNSQSIQLDTQNQSATYGQKKENLVLINNDINYISIFDSQSQKIKDSLVFNQNVDQITIQKYQIISFSQDNLIICFRKTDYYILQFSPLKILKFLYLSNVQNIYISNQYEMLVYSNLNQQVYFFCSKLQQFIQVKYDQLLISQLVLINERFIGISVINNNQQQFLVYDTIKQQNAPLNLNEGKIIDLKISNFLVVSKITSGLTNFYIFQFNQSDDTYIYYNLQLNGQFFIKQIFNQQNFNKVNSIYVMVMQDNIYAQYLKIKEAQNLNQVSQNIQVKQLNLPCSQNTQIKVEKDYFYYICPYAAFIYNSEIVFIQSIKYLVSSQNIINDIQYLGYNIFIVKLSQNQYDIYEIQNNFKYKIQSLTKISNPSIYSYAINMENLNIQLSLYGISDYNLFQATLNYKSKQFNYKIAEYQDQNQIQVKISNFIDNYKHIILQSQMSQNLETLRYQILYQTPSTINQFPVMNAYKNTDIVEIYSEQGQNLNQKYQLQISSTQFISDQIKNIKIGSMVLNFNLTDNKQLNFNQYKQLQQLQLSNMTIYFNQQSGSIYMNSYNTLIINEITFRDQIITTKILFSNISNFIINNMEFKNITIQSLSSFLQFDGVKNLLIRNLTINDCNFTQTVIQANNITNLTFQNLIITRNKFLQGFIFVNQSEGFFTNKIQILENQLKIIDNQQNQINPYLFNVLQVQQVQFNNIAFNNSLNLGFVNFTGMMINFQFLYSMQITNSVFSEINQNIPVILVTYGQSTSIVNMVVQKMKGQSFIQIQLVDQLLLKKLTFFSINEPFYELKNLEFSPSNQSNNYLLSIGGINNFILSNLYISFCNNVGMLSLIQYKVGKSAIQNSNYFQANDIIINNSISNLNEPAINLNSQQSKILELKVKNITFFSNLMNINQQQLFQMSNSSFSNIKLKNYSTTIYITDSQIIQVNNTQYFNISSLQQSAVFLIKSADQIIILNCTFKRNNNQQFENSSSLSIDNHSILNIQNSNNFQVQDSLFAQNICFGNGGAIYFYNIQESLIMKTKFVLNQVQQNSGGAIYASNSNINLNECIFQDNISKKERGGAIYSDNTYIQISNSNIFNNIAYVGGGIYYNKINTINIDKNSQIYRNKGRFYGNNLGSYPRKLLKVDLKTKQVYNKIIIQNFQSGNYTKQPIFVQYFDEENQILNFNVAESTGLISSSIKQEIENYQISIVNSTEIKNLTIILGQQLQYVKAINLFQLNITAGNNYKTDFQLVLYSEFLGTRLTLDIYLSFRKCSIGEILYQKQGYISCDKCVQGTYSVVDPYQGSSNNPVQCLKCPTNYAKSCYSNQIILQDNYWRESTQTDIIYSCKTLGCSETAYNQINGCKKGYIGPLCNTCDFKGIYWKTNYAQKGSDTGSILKIFFNYLQILSSSIDVYNQIPNIIGNVFQVGGDPAQVTFTNLDCTYKNWIISQLWFNRLVISQINFKNYVSVRELSLQSQRIQNNQPETQIEMITDQDKLLSLAKNKKSTNKYTKIYKFLSKMKSNKSSKQIKLLLATLVMIVKYISGEQKQIECQIQQEFFEASTQQCTSCQTNCQQCIDNNSCLACFNGTYLDLDLSCKVSCQNGYFMDYNNQTCNQCSDNKCIQCDQTNQCSQCIQGYQVSANGSTCLDIYCSEFHGQFDSFANRCSLDAYFYQTNILNNDNQRGEQSLASNFNYSSQKQESYGDILRIQAISVFSQFLIIGIKYQSILIFDFQNMKNIYNSSFNQPLQQINLIKNQLFILIGQYIETQKYYSNVQIIQLDMASYTQKQVYAFTETYQQIMLVENYVFLQKNSYFNILVLKSLQIQSLQVSDMTSFQYFQNEGIILISSQNSNVIYFMNIQFTNFYQITLPNDESFQLISSFNPQSIIITLSNDKSILNVYQLSQKKDKDNQLIFQLGSVIQQINYNNQIIQYNQIQSAIYLISDQEIQVWINSVLKIQIQLISRDTQYYIEEQSIIIKNDKEVIVYDSSFRQITFSLQFSIKITQMYFLEQSILYSIGNDIQVVSLDDSGKQTYIYQQFAFNNDLQYTYEQFKKIIFDKITKQKIILIGQKNILIYQLSKFDKSFILNFDDQIFNSFLFDREFYIILSNQVVQVNIDTFNLLTHNYNTNQIILINYDSLGIVLKYTQSDNSSSYLITVDQQNNFQQYQLDQVNLNVQAKEGQIVIYKDRTITVLDYNFQEKLQFIQFQQILNVFLIDGQYIILYYGIQIQICQSSDPNKLPFGQQIFLGQMVAKIIYSSMTKKFLFLNDGLPGSTQIQTYKYFNLQNPYDQPIQQVKIKLTTITLLVDSYCFNISNNIVQFLDLSTTGTDYTQVVFQNQISTIESINQQNLFLIRFLNDQQQLIVLDGNTQKQYLISQQISNVEQYINDFIFLTYPQRKLVVFALQQANQQINFQFIQEFNQQIYPDIKQSQILQQQNFAIYMNFANGSYKIIKQQLSMLRQDQYLNCDQFGKQNKFICSSTNGDQNYYLINTSTLNVIQISNKQFYKILTSQQSIYLLIYQYVQTDVRDYNFEVLFQFKLSDFDINFVITLNKKDFFVSTSNSYITLYDASGKFIFKYSLEVNQSNFYIFNQHIIVFVDQKLIKFLPSINQKSLITIQSILIQTKVSQIVVNYANANILLLSDYIMQFYSLSDFSLIKQINTQKGYSYIGSDNINNIELFNFGTQIWVYRYYQDMYQTKDIQIQPYQYYIDAGHGLLLIEDSKYNVLMIDYIGQSQTNQFALKLVINDVQRYSIIQNYSDQLSMLFMHQFYLTQSLGINDFYNNFISNLDTSRLNQYSVINFQMDKIAILNPNLNFISILNSENQNVEQIIYLDTNLSDQLVKEYQIINIKYSLLIAISFDDYYVFRIQDYSLVKKDTLSNCMKLFISKQFQTIFYIDSSNQLYLFDKISMQFQQIVIEGYQNFQNVQHINNNLVTIQLLQQSVNFIFYDIIKLIQINIPNYQQSSTDSVDKRYFINLLLIQSAQNTLVVLSFQNYPNQEVKTYQIISTQTYNLEQIFYLDGYQDPFILINQSDYFSYLYKLSSSLQTIIEPSDQNLDQIFAKFIKPCINVNIQVDQNHFYFICPLNTQIYDKNSMQFINNIKYLASDNSYMNSIQYVYKNIYLIIANNKIDVFEINYTFKQKIFTLSQLDYPKIYSQRIFPSQTEIYITIYGVTSYNIFQFTTRHNSTQFQQSKKTYELVQVGINSESDLQKNYIIQQLLVYGYETVRYQQILTNNLTINQPITVSDNLSQRDRYILEFQSNESQMYQLTIQNSYLFSSQFQNIKFSKLLLNFALQDNSSLDINPNNQIKYFQISESLLKSSGKDSKIYFHDISTLILNEIELNQENVNNYYEFENIQTLIINNLAINNLNFISNFNFFTFSNCPYMTLRNITIVNSNFSNYVFDFQIINNQTLIQNFTVKNSYFGNGAYQLNLIDNDQNNYLSYIFCLSKVQTANLIKLNFSNINNLGLIEYNGNQQSVNSQLIMDSIYIYDNIINFPSLRILQANNITINNFLIQKAQANSKTSILEILLAQQILISQLQIIQLDYKYQQSLRNLNIDSPSYAIQMLGVSKAVLKQIIMDQSNQIGLINVDSYQSTIQQIYLSIFFNISQCSFSNINNNITGSPSLIANQVQKITIQNSRFQLQMNYNLDNDKQTDSQLDGVLNFQKCSNIIIQQSIFSDNQSFKNGGAIYFYNNQNIKIENSKFISNKALTMSGGAIYLISSNIIIINSLFRENKSLMEKGGAIYAQGSSIQLTDRTSIIENSALIGGGIYYDLATTRIKKEKSTIVLNNLGYFYGNNFGSQPRNIKQINYISKVQSDTIIVSNYQSGNYTKQEVYIQYFDEEDQPLNFTVKNNQIALSSSIQQEINLYQIQFDTQQITDEIVISIGQQAQFDSSTNLFKLNFTASFKNQTSFDLSLVSNLASGKVSIPLKLNFRQCEIGEIKYLRSGYIQCDQCSEGTYSLVDPNKSSYQVQCKICPDSAQYCQGRSIILKDNYWRESEITDDIYQCQFNGCSMQQVNIDGCVRGYSGVLCQVCDIQGEYWQESYGSQGNQCLRCSDLYLVYIITSLAIVFYILYIHYSLNSQAEQKILILQLNYLRKLNMLYLSKSKLQGSDSAGLTKVFLHYIQIFSTTINFYENIPLFVKQPVDVGGNPTNVTYTSFDCLFKGSPIQLLWIDRLLMQLAQVVLISLIVFLYNIYQNRKYKKKFYGTIYAVFLYLFYYPALTKLFISLCWCQKIGSHYYLSSDYSQMCFTKTHILTSIFIIYPLTVIWTLIIPFLLFLKMRTALKQNKNESIKYTLTYYILQQGYRKQYYYWELNKQAVTTNQLSKVTTEKQLQQNENHDGYFSTPQSVTKENNDDLIIFQNSESSIINL
ncbi:hypothetical protein ABPG74_007150 [Tetrahymena malaccensis]